MAAASEDPVRLVRATVTVSASEADPRAHVVNLAPATPRATSIAVMALPMPSAIPAIPSRADAAPDTSALTENVGWIPLMAPLTAEATSEDFMLAYIET